MTRRQSKITKQQLELIQGRFQVICFFFFNLILLILKLYDLKEDWEPFWLYLLKNETKSLSYVILLELFNGPWF